MGIGLCIPFWNTTHEVFSAIPDQAQDMVDVAQKETQKNLTSAQKLLQSLSEKTILQNPSFPQKPACFGKAYIPFVQNTSGAILIFVSFSMPEATLKSLFAEAQHVKARLIIRGLINDSFVQTQQKLKDLGIVVDIDPTLFTTYGVKEVPTFVRVVGKSYDLLKGNVSLHFAQEQFQKHTAEKAGG